MYWRLSIIIHEVGSSPMTTLVILVKWGIFPSMAHRCIFQVGESWQSSVALWSGSTYTWYPLVNKHSCWKFWFIVDLPIKMVIFHGYVSLPVGNQGDFTWLENMCHEITSFTLIWHMFKNHLGLGSPCLTGTWKIRWYYLGVFCFARFPWWRYAR
jgi:hypothetical protein